MSVIDLDMAPNEYTLPELTDLSKFRKRGKRAAWMLGPGRRDIIIRALLDLAYSRPIRHIPRDVLFAAADELMNSKDIDGNEAS
jgi:hypothetical protein